MLGWLFAGAQMSSLFAADHLNYRQNITIFFYIFGTQCCKFCQKKRRKFIIFLKFIYLFFVDKLIMEYLIMPNTSNLMAGILKNAFHWEFRLMALFTNWHTKGGLSKHWYRPRGPSVVVVVVISVVKFISRMRYNM